MDSRPSMQRWVIRGGVLLLLLSPQLVLPAVLPGLGAGDRLLAELVVLPALGVGSLLLYHFWRVTGHVDAAWICAIGVTVSVHLLTVLPARLWWDLPPVAAGFLTEGLMLAALVALTVWPPGRSARVDPALAGAGIALVLTAVAIVLHRLAADTPLPVTLPYLAMAGDLVVGGYIVLRIRRALTLPTVLRGPLAAAALLLFLARASLQVTGPWDLGVPPGLVLAVLATAGAVLAITATVEGLAWVIEQERERLTELRSRLEEERWADHETLHEIRASVASIAAASAVIRQGIVTPHSTTSRGQLQDMMADEIARLLRLLDHNTDRTPRVFGLDSVLERVVLAHRLRGTDVCCDPGHVSVFAIADDVMEILNTLLDNAARHARCASVRISVETRDDRVLVRVADDGPGIPEALAESVFDAGVRGPASSGTGTGLYRAGRLASGAGGSLTLERGHPGGARFVLDLPGALRSSLSSTNDDERHAGARE